MPEECPREISELIAQCRMDPEDRPSAKEFYDTLINAPQVLVLTKPPIDAQNGI